MSAWVERAERSTSKAYHIYLRTAAVWSRASGSMTPKQANIILTTKEEKSNVVQIARNLCLPS